MRNDVVYWLQERALRRYGATMNAAHTETQEWLWAEEITRLREENAQLQAQREKDQRLNHETESGLLEENVRLREENARLREALKPFAGILKGNYSHQSDDMPIKAGANQYDLVFVFTLGDLRAAAAAIRGKVKDEAACPEPDEAP